MHFLICLNEHMKLKVVEIVSAMECRQVECYWMELTISFLFKKLL